MTRLRRPYITTPLSRDISAQNDDYKRRDGVLGVALDGAHLKKSEKIQKSCLFFSANFDW